MIFKTLSLASSAHYSTQTNPPLSVFPADKPVTAPLLLFIEYYNDRGEIAELRIYRHIAPQWRHLALLLGLSNAEVQSIMQSNFHRNEDATNDMLRKWLGRDLSANWRRLIQKMREVELISAAATLVKALQNRVEDE